MSSFERAWLASFILVAVIWFGISSAVLHSIHSRLIEISIAVRHK